jgi:hypothetical protein
VTNLNQIVIHLTCGLAAGTKNGNSWLVPSSNQYNKSLEKSAKQLDFSDHAEEGSAASRSSTTPTTPL